MGQVTRVLVVWCPDWPVIAARTQLGVAEEVPVAVISGGTVFACSASARAEGVRRGLRVREAQARCPHLVVAAYEPAQDARAFEPVLAAVEEVTPGVQLVRPGTCVLRARGPARYYGSEEAVASELLRCLDGLEHGTLLPQARVGVADGPFAAEQTARSTGAGRVRIIPPGGTPAFLAPQPIDRLGLTDLAPVLHRLGLRTLGDLAALDRDTVRARFGPAGEHAHDLASGMDDTAVVARTPPPQLEQLAEFEPPLDRVDQVTFAVRGTAARLVAGLTRAGLVCTSVRVVVTDEEGRVSERTWSHPRTFTAADVVDRVRWQLTGDGPAGAGLASPITRVVLQPVVVDDIGHHEEGLWGGADERIHHGLTRVQSMLGHDGVLTATIGGGRALADRQVLVPWGDRPAGATRADQPWPGALPAPAPAPATVFQEPHPVVVLTATGEPVQVTARGDLTGPIAAFSPAGSPAGSSTGAARGARRVRAWAGPWPMRERWWDPAATRAVHRVQLVDSDGTAWLLALTGTGWVAEARYD